MVIWLYEYIIFAGTKFPFKRHPIISMLPGSFLASSGIFSCNRPSHSDNGSFSQLGENIFLIVLCCIGSDGSRGTRTGIGHFSRFFFAKFWHNFSLLSAARGVDVIFITVL